MRRALLLGALAVLLIALMAAGFYRADEVPSPDLLTHRGDATLPVCVGFHPSHGRFGGVGYQDIALDVDCPSGSAIVAERRLMLKEIRDDSIEVTGWCCPLPAGALTERVSFGLSCPEDAVATGTRGVNQEGKLLDSLQPLPSTMAQEGLRRVLKCSFLDTTRFQLGPKQNAVWIAEARPRTFLGIRLYAPFTRKFPERVLWHHRIPLAIRYAVGRLSVREWENDTCAGMPWGSVLVGGGRPTICPFAHRSLEYAGAVGDPPRGTPVPLYPDCAALDNVLSPSPHCLNPSEPRDS